MIENKNLSFKDYLASSAISIGVILVLMELLSFVVSMESIISNSTNFFNKISLLFMAIHLIGGLVGTFILARKINDPPLHLGVVTSLITYIIEFVYFLLFGGLINAGFLIIVTLMSGSIVGVMIANSNFFSSK